ncbi:MAG: M24 family metallopeptidase [Acidimicrobiales bacterium]
MDPVPHSDLAPLRRSERAARLLEVLSSGDQEAGPTTGADPAIGGSQACDALLVTNVVNICYLTGFTGSAAMLAVGPDGLLLTTDGRYEAQAAEELEASGAKAEIFAGPPAKQYEALREKLSGYGRVGLEAGSVTWSFVGVVEDKVLQDKASPVPTRAMVEALRRGKSPGEVDRMVRACEIATAALERVKEMLDGERTEAEVAARLEYEMRLLGAKEAAFSTIVASGTNAAKPHSRPTSRPLRPDEPVVVDFGAIGPDGYRCDITRTLWPGAGGDRPVEQPSERAPEELSRIFDITRRAQLAGIAAVKPGATARDVDAACRDLIAAEGYEEAFAHGTGHGVGLQVHELPGVGKTSEDTLQVGDVVTIEPGIYLPGAGGVRIEDMVLVTETGGRLLSRGGGGC